MWILRKFIVVVQDVWEGWLKIKLSIVACASTNNLSWTWKNVQGRFVWGRILKGVVFVLCVYIVTFSGSLITLDFFVHINLCALSVWVLIYPAHFTGTVHSEPQSTRFPDRTALRWGCAAFTPRRSSVNRAVVPGIQTYQKFLSVPGCEKCGVLPDWSVQRRYVCRFSLDGFPGERLCWTWVIVWIRKRIMLKGTMAAKFYQTKGRTENLCCFVFESQGTHSFVPLEKWKRTNYDLLFVVTF